MTATFTAPLAALTTVFTPPCPITWLLTTTKVPSQYPSFATTAPASCDPPSWGQYVPQRGFEYYSPAICPSGFYVGPSCIITNPRTAQGFPAIQGGETAAYCIPNGHTCTSDTSDFRGGVWGVSRTASVNGAQVTVGPAIQIRWRDEDIDNLETDPITPGARTAQPRLPQQTLGDTEISSTPDPTTTSTQPPSSSTSSSTRLTVTPINLPLHISSTSTTESTSTSTSTPSSFSSSSSSVTLPASSTLAQESQSSTSAATTESPSKQPVNDIEKGRGGGNSSSSNFIVAAIVLTAVLITIIATYGAYTILQRYRRYRAGETTEFFVFQVEAWVRRQLRLKQRVGGTTMEEKEGDGRNRRKIPDAELGTEGPLPELGSAQPFGTKENPAELPTMERWSWRSRMSRILTVRTRRGSLASRP